MNNMPDIPFLLFSQRRRVAALYQNWCLNNGIRDCPESIVAFLQFHGLLDTRYTLEYIENHKEVNTDV